MAKGFNTHGKPVLRGEDREAAARAADAINAYWRARGREVNARVNAAGEIISDMSAAGANQTLTNQAERHLRAALNANARALSASRFVEYLKTRPTGRTLIEICNALSMAETTAYYRLKQLRDDGVIEAYKTRPKGPLFYRMRMEART